MQGLIIDQMGKFTKPTLENTKKEFDVFLSYARDDFERASALRNALIKTGLEVWFDETEIRNHEALQRRIEQGLSHCKAFVCCYSKTYPQRRWCMAELAAAYSAAVNNEFERRLLLVNFEPSIDHIIPASLLDTLLPSLTDADANSAQIISENIAECIPHLATTLGQLGVSAVPRWFGPTRLSSPRFVNRAHELWSIHDALIQPQRIMNSGTSSHGVCQIHAMGGMGKSLLAEEYAWRFAAAWPMGVFWLDGGGDEARRVGQTSEQAEEKLNTAMQYIVRQLGGNPTGMLMIDIQVFIRGRIDELSGLGLWVVDDLPSDLDMATIRNWLAPHPRLRTLITTRSRQYGSIGIGNDLKSLGPDSGCELLTFDDDDGSSWATELSLRLGGHPLALDVTRAALQAMRGIQSPEEFMAMLEQPNDDVLALASDLADELPNGHERNIAQTLLAGLENLPDPTRQLLTLMSLCSDSLIPVTLLVRACSELARQQHVKAEIFVLQNVKNLHDRALCTRDKHGSLMMHTLVSRAVRYRESKKTEWLMHIAMMREALVEQMGGFERFDDLEVLALLAPHARSTAELDTSEPELLWQCLGQYEFSAGRFVRAARLLRKSWDRAKIKWGSDHLHTSVIANEYGLAATYAYHADEAVAAFEDYIHYVQSLGPIGIESLMLAKGNMAAALRAGGQNQKSLELEREVADWRTLNLGSDDPLTLTSYHQLSIAEWSVGNQQTALDIGRKALEGRRRVLGNDHMHTLLSMQTCAQFEAQAGSQRVALELARENARRRVALLGKNHPYAFSGLRTAVGIGVSSDLFTELGMSVDELPGLSWYHRNNHAVALLTSGQYEDALTIIDELLATQTSLSDHDTLLLRHNRTAGLVNLGQHSEASREIQQIISEEKLALGEYHWLTLATRYYQALNTTPDVTDANAVAMLEPVAKTMIKHLPLENRYRMRCELELELRRSLCGPQYSSPAHVNEIVTRVIAAHQARGITALSAQCAKAFIEVVHGNSNALNKLVIAINDLTTQSGTRHPESLRYRWLLCRFLYDNGDKDWGKHYQHISWLAHQNEPRNRIEAWVLQQIRSRGLDK